MGKGAGGGRLVAEAREVLDHEGDERRGAPARGRDLRGVTTCQVCPAHIKLRTKTIGCLLGRLARDGLIETEWARLLCY